MEEGNWSGKLGERLAERRRREERRGAAAEGERVEDETTASMVGVSVSWQLRMRKEGFVSVAVGLPLGHVDEEGP